jgi:DTW domain-containing protein YfiP
VILDATWQQAKKMYRQSSYLQKADKIALDQAPVSRFQRRRNQRDGGLCTAECVIELLKSAEDELHTKLEYSFSSFNGLAAGRALT